MAFKRDDVLRNAEKALRSGKLDQAIAEYARILEYQPRDFTTANTLGDLYARTGQYEAAIAQFTRIAEQFLADGFYPKASALFKKILKIRPDDEQALLRLGQLSAKQGLLADARAFLHEIAARRRRRGDHRGADDIVIELADTEAADADTRLQAARILAGRGEVDAAAERLRTLAVDLLEKDRALEAVDVLRETVHLVPGDRVARRQLIGLLTDLDQPAEAEVYLTRDAAEGDPAMLLLFAKAELEAGRLDEGRADIRAAAAHEPLFARVLNVMRQIAPGHPEAGYIAAEALADAALERRQVDRAVEALRGFLALAPAHVAGGLRFVEICLEEGLDDLLLAAQAALADAYIAAGQPDAGRVIAEDLAAAAPADPDARDRLVRARLACGLPLEHDMAQRAEGREDEEDEEANGHRERSLETPAADKEWPAPLEAALSDLVEDIPEFEIYVYGQPVAEPEPEPEREPEPELELEPEPELEPELEPEPELELELERRTEPMEPAEPVEPVEPEESEEAFIARLLAAEAEQEALPPASPAPAHEIDLTAQLDALDEARPEELLPAPAEDAVDGARARGRAQADEQAEAALEEASMAAALGQIDDAERLYGAAARSVRFRFRAAVALGRVLVREGRTADAIEWFERATEVPAPDRDAGHALLFELGETLERHGETMRALAIFMELHADAGDYRDVAARVERLARAEIGG
jgi:protein involved in temperature-dependent protein secretion